MAEGLCCCHRRSILKCCFDFESSPSTRPDNQSTITAKSEVGRRNGEMIMSNAIRSSNRSTLTNKSAITAKSEEGRSRGEMVIPTIKIRSSKRSTLSNKSLITAKSEEGRDEGDLVIANPASLPYHSPSCCTSKKPLSGSPPSTKQFNEFMKVTPSTLPIKTHPNPHSTPPKDPLLMTPPLNMMHKLLTSYIAPDWYPIGLSLDIEGRILRIIAEDNPRSVERCCYTMFDRWLSHDEGTGGAPRHWKRVFKALKDTGYSTLVKDVRQKVLEDNNITSSL